MHALTRSAYGPPDRVLQVVDTEPPSVGAAEVLVRVHAAGVNAGDIALVRGSPYLIRPAYGLVRPRRTVVGQDLAGIVERVGAKVTRFRPGDRVFGGGFGTFAEYAAAPERRLAHLPTGLPFEDAAAAPIAGLTALQGMRDAGGVRAGHRVLVNGASGGVGTYAVQIAVALGAEVTAVCSTPNVDQARSLGAARVIDYTIEDFTESAERFDVVFDNAANRSLSATRSVLATGGTLVPNGGKLDSRWLANVPRMLGAVTASLFIPSKVRLHAQSWDPDDLDVLGGMLEAGTIRSVIERRYPLAHGAEAVAYVAGGHARGKVVITV
jgi:NADPH:quinone reductase-like Zn-dependent oxidoreductase